MKLKTKQYAFLIFLATICTANFAMVDDPQSLPEPATPPQRNVPTLRELAGAAARSVILEAIQDPDEHQTLMQSVIFAHPHLANTVLPPRYVLGKTLTGHKRLIKYLAYNADGTQLASGSWDYTIKIWNPRTGLCLQTLNGHTNEVSSLSFHPHKKNQLTSGSWDGTIKTWDTESGQCQQTLKGHTNHVRCLVYNPDGTQLASASRDKTIKLWDTESGQCQQTIDGHKRLINCLAFNHDGTQIVSGSNSKSIKIWNPITGQCQQTLKVDTLYVRYLAYNADGTQLASILDSNIKIWDTQSGQCQQTLKGQTGCVNHLAFHPHKNQLASGSHKIIKLWNTESGQCQQTIGGQTSDVISLAYNPDGTQLASTSLDSTNTVKLWRKATVTERLIMAYMKHHNLTSREQLPAHMHKAFDAIPKLSRNGILKYGLQNDEDK